MSKTITSNILGLLYRNKNVDRLGGSIRLFKENGPVLYCKYQELLRSTGAIRRIWNLYLLVIIHIGKGETTAHANGWYFSWFKIGLKTDGKGTSLKFTPPSVYKDPIKPNMKK